MICSLKICMSRMVYKHFLYHMFPQGGCGTILVFYCPSTLVLSFNLVIYLTVCSFICALQTDCNKSCSKSVKLCIYIFSSLNCLYKNISSAFCMYWFAWIIWHWKDTFVKDNFSTLHFIVYCFEYAVKLLTT